MACICFFIENVEISSTERFLIFLLNLLLVVSEKISILIFSDQFWVLFFKAIGSILLQVSIFFLKIHLTCPKYFN